MPRAIPSIPSVATMGLTRSFTTTKPLTSPTATPTPITMAMASIGWMPVAMTFVPTVPDRAMVEPTEMSRAPEMSPNVAPTDTTISTAVAWPALSRLFVVRKLRATLENRTISMRSTTPSVDRWPRSVSTAAHNRSSAVASLVPGCTVVAVIGTRPWAAGRRRPRRSAGCPR